MSGAEATFGQSTHAGIVLAIEEQNARGGVRGKRIELVSYDDRGRTQEAGTAVTRLITEDKVVALLGAATSSRSIAGAEVAQQYGVPMITPSSTNVKVTAVGDKVFRVCFIDSFQSYAAAKFAREGLGARRVAVLFDQGQAYSTGLKDAFVLAFEELGGEVVDGPGLQHGRPGLQRAAHLDSRGRPRCRVRARVLHGCGQHRDPGPPAGDRRPPAGGTDGTRPSSPPSGARPCCAPTTRTITRAQDPSPAVQGFLRSYGDRYGGEVPESAAALGYDAARVLFAAMERARSFSGQDLAQAVAATRDFPGVTGTISMDRERNARKPAVVLEMRKATDGRILPTYVTTIEPR